MTLDEFDWELMASRVLKRKICLHCGAVNAWTSKRCRECRRDKFRPKSGATGRGHSRGGKK